MKKIDESYTILDGQLRWRKPKFKVVKDVQVYIFKYGDINN